MSGPGGSYSFPAARAGNGSRNVRLATTGGAVAFAFVAVLAGRAYQRPKPAPEAGAPGMKVGSDFLSLAPDAPERAVLRIASPSPAAPRWTAPIPARVLFDESLTSRLGAPLAGRISAVYIERGQQVKAGQPLYTVSSASLAELRAAVELSRVERDTAEKDYERTQSAVDAQALPGKELVAARQKLEQAQLSLRVAEQKLSSLSVKGASDSTAFTVTAPRDGVVVERSVAIGQTVSPDGGSLVAIADLSSVWVVADIFDTKVAGLTPGAEVRVVIGDDTADARLGTIDQISAVVDPERHTVPVRIKIANPDGALRPYAYVQVQLRDPTPTVAMLPASAVMSDGEHSFVYVEQAGTFRRRDIHVGSVVGGIVPVTSGLSTADRVVVQGGILIDNEIDLESQ